MNRRQVIQFLAASSALAALHARAQSKPPVVIGWLSSATRETNAYSLKAFNEGMAGFGWKLGVQYVLEERWAEGRAERLPVLAQELAVKKPAVIVAATTTVANFASKAAPATPIVLVGDPLATGLVKSLARPSGMITGLSNIASETNEKLVELLHESIPNLRRIGFLADPSLSSHDTTVGNARRASERYRIDAIIVDVKPDDLEVAMARLAKEKVQALVLLSSLWFATYSQHILKVAAAHRWPVVGNQRIYAESGALFSYGSDRVALWRRSAYFVDRILKGTKPGDLPIEQPTIFEMVVNMKTAKTLGISIPQTILVRATKVIE